MAPLEPSGPSESAHSGRPTLAPVSWAIASSTLALTELSAKIASHALAADRVDELREVAGGRLRLRRQRRDHGADHAQPVAARVVAERVVGGHEHALVRRDLIQALPHLAVERADPARLAAGVRAIGGGARRVGLRERVADRRDGRLRAARVLPPVRVLPLRPDAVEQVEHRRVGARAVDRAAEPLVEVAARAHDERRARQRLHVAGPDLVVVRVAVGREHPAHRGAIAGHGAGEVGGLGGGGDDRRAAVSPVRAAAGERERARGDGEEQGEAHRRSPY